MKIAICLLAVVAAVWAGVVKRQAAADVAFVLPSGIELILASVTGGFTCEGKIYGYYADTNNECRIFHVCVPHVDENGVESPALYSFFCGNLTVFDQQNLVCSHPDSAIPCSEAPNFYNVNENFGKTDKPQAPALVGEARAPPAPASAPAPAPARAAPLAGAVPPVAAAA